MSKRSLLATIFISILFTGLLSAKDTIKYVGSSTVGVFIHDAAKVYTDTKFDIDTKPESSGGESYIAKNLTDIGGVARELSSKFRDKKLVTHQIGRDAIGVWLNSENPVNNISLTDLKKIFTGKIVNWKELGGEDLPITVYLVEFKSGTRKVFQERILDGDSYAGKRVKVVQPDKEIFDVIKNDRGGIGQLSFAFLRNYPLADSVKPVRINDQEPGVSNPDYPITRPLYLVTNGKVKPHVQKFIDWSKSDEGQSIVKKYFIGVK